MQCILDYLYLDYSNLDYPNFKLATQNWLQLKKLVASWAQFNPFSEDINWWSFFHWSFDFVNKLCCYYYEYRGQKVIFFSAMVFSSVMPKNYPLRGKEKGQKIILDYLKFFCISERPVFKLSSACSDNRGCTVLARKLCQRVIFCLIIYSLHIFHA